MLQNGGRAATLAAVETELVEAVEVDEALRRVVVEVRDSEHPQRAVFTYLVAPTGPGGLIGVSVQSVPRQWQPWRVQWDLAETLSVATVRDLPLARWQQAALQTALTERPEPLDLTDEIGRLHAIGDEVDRVHPGLARRIMFGPASPAERRRFESARKLAEVAYDYRELVNAGTPDPAAQLARQRGAKPGTVRTWLTRARQAGFLDPSVKQAGMKQAGT